MLARTFALAAFSGLTLAFISNPEIWDAWVFDDIRLEVENLSAKQNKTADEQESLEEGERIIKNRVVLISVFSVFVSAALYLNLSIIDYLLRRKKPEEIFDDLSTGLLDRSANVYAIAATLTPLTEGADAAQKRIKRQEIDGLISQILKELSSTLSDDNFFSKGRLVQCLVFEPNAACSKLELVCGQKGNDPAAAGDDFVLKENQCGFAGTAFMKRSTQIGRPFVMHKYWPYWLTRRKDTRHLAGKQDTRKPEGFLCSPLIQTGHSDVIAVLSIDTTAAPSFKNSRDHIDYFDKVLSLYKILLSELIISRNRIKEG